MIDRMREQGVNVGLVKIKMFRPFPKDPIRNALRGKKKIAVIERNLSVGQCGIFHQEIKWALNANEGHKFAPIYGFVAGLGGLDITPQLIEKAVRHTLSENPPGQEILWLGLESDEITGE